MEFCGTQCEGAFPHVARRNLSYPTIGEFVHNASVVQLRLRLVQALSINYVAHITIRSTRVSGRI